MKVVRALLGCALLYDAGAAAAPLIDRRGVVNAASLTPGPLPGGAIARGSLFALRGREMAHVSVVRIRTRGLSWDTPPVLVRDTLVHAVMPSGVPLGPASVLTGAGGEWSAPAAVNIVPRALGFFPVARLTPARRGASITLMATGLGPPEDLSLEIFAGGVPAKVLSAGPAPGAPGRDRITFQIPTAAPTGCYVPVQARLTGYIPSNAVTLAIEPRPLDCHETEEVRSAIETGGRAGIAALFRGSLFSDLDPNETIESTIEGVFAAFRADSGGAAAAGALLSLPPRGACTAFSGWLDIGNIEESLRGDLLAEGKPLDAGNRLTLAGRGKSISFGRLDKAPEIYLGRLGGVLPGTREPPLPPFLESGVYTLSGSGGRDVGSFKAPLQVDRSPVVWTNRRESGKVDRERGLTVEWSGGDPASLVAIAAINIDHRARAAAAFLCIASADDDRFTVPALATQSLPLSRLEKDQSLGFLFVGSLARSGPRSFSAPGVQAAVAVAGSFSGRTATFR